MNQEVWTVGNLLRTAAEDLGRREVDAPRLSAELLMGHVLGLDRVKLILEGSRPLDDAELQSFRDLFKRRRNHEPVAYLLGEKEFRGLSFSVDKRVLIPRPDTEILVELALDKTKHRDLHGRALDLCTGSGCVAVSFAKERPTWQVTATDLSADALDVARHNALKHSAVWNTSFIEGDLFDALPEEARFEMILSNPPYIPPREIDELDEGVREFEPRMALDGGDDGLDFYRQIAQGARKRLVRGGVLAVEVGAGQAPDVERLFIDAGFTDPERRKDYGDHERVVAVRAPR